MDNWGEIIYVNEEQQKVGEREAEGQRGPPWAQAGEGAVSWPRLEVGDRGVEGIGACHGTSGLLPD